MKSAAAPSASKPATTTRPATNSSSPKSASSSSSATRNAGRSSTLSRNKNGNSSFSKDPETSSVAEENKAKKKARSFQEKFLEGWGDEESRVFGSVAAKDALESRPDDAKSESEAKVEAEKSKEPKSGKTQPTSPEQVPVENKDDERPMGPLTQGQMREQQARERQRVVETLTGENLEAAYQQVIELYRAAANDPEALRTMMAGFDGADPRIQELMFNGVRKLSEYAAQGGEDRRQLMQASQDFFRHIMDAPQRLQEKIAKNPLGQVRLIGRLPGHFNAQSAQTVMAVAMSGSPSQLAVLAQQAQDMQPLDHSGLVGDTQAGHFLNGATQQIYDDLQRMPGSLNLAQRAAQSYEGTLSPEQMADYLDQAKQNYHRGGHQGEQATQALARNVDQLSSADIMRLRGNREVLAAALKPGSETRERLMQEALEGNNPALKRFLTEQFSQGSMSNDRFQNLTGEVGREVAERIQEALSKDPGELRGVEHLYAEYGNMLRAQQMYLSGGEHSEQVDYGQVMERLELVQRQLEPEVLAIQKSMGNYSSVRRQQEYLESQDFQDRLRLADPAERADLAREELAKLNTFNPEAAEQLAPGIQERLGLMQVSEPGSGLALFQGQSEETQEQVVDGLIQATLTTAAGGAKAYNASVKGLDAVATRQIASILDGISPQEVKSTADLSRKFEQGLAGARAELQKIIDAGGEGAQDARKALRSLDRVSQWANNFDEIGGWGALGAALGTTSLALGGFPQNGMEAAGAATGIAGILGNLDDTAKLGTRATRSVAERLFKAGGKFDELAKLRGVAGMSNLLGKLKILGPVSDIAGGALDTYSAYSGAERGDVHETIGQSISAVGGLAAGVGGFVLLSNPVGWVLVGAGTAAALAGMGYQWAFGMDEQEEFLQRVGVRRESW